MGYVFYVECLLHDHSRFHHDYEWYDAFGKYHCEIDTRSSFSWKLGKRILSPTAINFVSSAKSKDAQRHRAVVIPTVLVGLNGFDFMAEIISRDVLQLDYTQV